MTRFDFVVSSVRSSPSLTIYNQETYRAYFILCSLATIIAHSYISFHRSSLSLEDWRRCLFTEHRK